MKKRDAMTRLDAAVRTMWVSGDRRSWLSYRRALRALLREIEYEVLTTLDRHHWDNTLASRNAVGDAVLGRRR